MNREGYTSKREAKRALMEHGYRVAGTGRPQLWIGPYPKRERVTVALASCIGGKEEWRIVPYPEPAVCNAREAEELAKRDRVVTSGSYVQATEPQRISSS